MNLRNSRLPVLLAVSAALVAGASFGQQKSAPAAHQAAELVIHLTNESRVQEGLDKVVVNPRLMEAARYFAEYMARTGQFSHDADGMVPATRAQKHGYDYCIVSENIANRYSSGGATTRDLAQGFVEGWKKSSGHRKNMLDPDVTETGAAVARGVKPGDYYAVQMFGRPSSRAIKFSIANQTNVAIRYRIESRIYSLAPRQTRTHAHCRSEELRFDWPHGQQDNTIAPKDGERLAIVRSDSGGFSVKPE